MTRRSEDRPRDETLRDLTDAVNELAGQVELLRTVLDEIREELSWAVRNCGLPVSQAEPFVLKSMPLDPATPDWWINRRPSEESQDKSGPVVKDCRETLFD